MSSEQKTSTAPSREAKAERSQSAKAEPALTDRQLVEKCLKGDQRQWEKLYHRCQPRLRNAIEILLGLNSPDKYLVDEISARVWHALLRDECRLLALYDPQRDSTLDAFLMGLARIEIMRHNRAERRRQSHELIRGRRKLEEQRSHDWKAGALMNEFASTLTKSEREFLDQHLGRCTNTEDDAEPLSLSTTAVWQRSHRIRLKLKSFFDES